MSSLGGPWMVIYVVSIAFINVGADLSGMTWAASQRMHLSSMWKTMNLWMKTKSHSTWRLNVSGRSTLQALLGPGLAHSRQT